MLVRKLAKGSINVDLYCFLLGLIAYGNTLDWAHESNY